MAESTLFDPILPVKVRRLPVACWRKGMKFKPGRNRKPTQINRPGQPPILIGVRSGQPIPAPKYAVTEDGQVYSLTSIPPRRLSLSETTNGYIKVSLWIEGRPVSRSVHRLVAEAFNLPKPNGADVVRHLDGNKKNNRLSNLAWGTFGENSRDAVLAGAIKSGEESPSAKLTTTQVIEIKRLIARGDPLYRIGKQFGVTGANIRQIRDGVSWADVVVGDGVEEAIESRRRQSWLREDTAQSIRRMILEGHPYKAIQKELRVSKQQIIRVRKLAGIPKGKRRPANTGPLAI